MLLMIDNYDSFTYNLVQYFGELGAEVRVYRNDQITMSEIETLAPERIVVSPGPCTPKEAGISVEVIKTFAGRVPILGVCLGHQSIGEAFGGRIVHAGEIMHGKTSMATHDGETIFAGLSQPFEVGRYHSLSAEQDSHPDDLLLTSQTDRGEIMGVRHRTLPLEGVQFHPESVLTPEGDRLMANFMRLTST